ncbi:hypothetical protein BSG1_20960 [Bacillus sp. SG-1]|nr:hypothetical protein BSG1_20960 [Bacillus sp. SG-1]
MKEQVWMIENIDETDIIFRKNSFMYKENKLWTF